MKRLVVLLISICLLLCSCSNNKNSHSHYDLISVFDIGSNYDNIAHALASALEQEFKKPVNIINTKNEAQINSSNNGYTIIFSDDLNGKYFPLMPISNEPYVIISNHDTIYDNIENLLTIISRNPNEILFALPQNDTNTNVEKAILNKYGYEPKPIEYKNSEECIKAVIDENVEFAIIKYSYAKEYILENKVILLSVFSENSLHDFPKIPTISDIITDSENDIRVPLNPLTLFVTKDSPEYMKDYLRNAIDNAINNVKLNRFIEENNYEKLYVSFHSYEEISKMFELCNKTLQMVK